MDQNFTQVGFSNDPRCSFDASADVFCHELQIHSAAFVYQGSLYMISRRLYGSAERLYFIERKGLIILITIYPYWYFDIAYDSNPTYF